MAKMHPIEKFFVNHRFQYYLHKWFVLGQLLTRLPAANYKEILEIGAGVGITTEFLTKKYPQAHIMATDFDEDSIAIAQQSRYLPHVTFEQADATRLRYPDNQYDAAFSVLTLHHIEKFENAIAELSRVVKRGGDVYILDIPSVSFNLFHFRKSKVPGLFRKDDLIKLGKKHGLYITELGGTYRFSLHGKKL